MRINKFLAKCGICSRRTAETLVLSGFVSINGVLISDLAHQVDEMRDVVTVKGKVVKITKSAPCLIALNKPVQVISSAKDPQGRKTVLDCLPNEFKKNKDGSIRRLYPIGRLDYFSEGLILLTDDGDLTNRLIRPAHRVEKVYEVSVRGNVSDKILNEIRSGMILPDDGTKLAPVKVSLIVKKNEFTLLRMTLHQGVNRQIRRMCNSFDLVVLRLIRISEGPIKLENLKPGESRILSKSEIEKLYKASGLDLLE